MPKWEDYEIEYLENNYPTNLNIDIAKVLNRTRGSISLKANDLHLLKCKEHISYLASCRNKSRSRNLDYASVANIASNCKVKKEFKKKDSTAYNWATENNYLDDICSHMLPQRYSTPQLICKYIFDILLDEECEYNTNNIIKPYELDLYYPNYKLAIEYNGKYWHSDKFNDNTDTKRIVCEKLGIELIVILEDSNNYEKDIKEDIVRMLPKINEVSNKEITVQDIDNLEIDYSIVYEDILDKDDIIRITSSYTKYSEFYKENRKLEKRLRHLNLLEKYTGHMFKMERTKWNIEKIMLEFNKNETIKYFRKFSNPCYRYIKKHNLRYLINDFYQKN